MRCDAPIHCESAVGLPSPTLQAHPSRTPRADLHRLVVLVHDGTDELLLEHLKVVRPHRLGHYPDVPTGPVHTSRCVMNATARTVPSRGTGHAHDEPVHHPIIRTLLVLPWTAKHTLTCNPQLAIGTTQRSTQRMPPRSNQHEGASTLLMRSPSISFRMSRSWCHITCGYHENRNDGVRHAEQGVA